MRTIREVIGECPIGKIVKETKVDMFGYYAGHRIVKLVRKDWYYEKLMRSYEAMGFSYSDLKFYCPDSDLKEVSI